MEEETWIMVEGEEKGVRIGGKAGWMIGDIALVYGEPELSLNEASFKTQNLMDLNE